jgi:phosphatidate phosphatase APP1
MPIFGVIMKVAFLSLSVLLFSKLGFAKTLVVSDIDDTIKVTDVLNKANAVKNGLFSKKAFSGMNELFNEFNNSDTIITYVSGSPTVIKEIVDNFLEDNHFPQKENLTLKKGKVSTYDYKLAVIRDQIAKMNPDKIILLGDDTEFDPEVYNTISKENKIESIYIRAVQNRKLPNNAKIINFISPVEIAANELLKGNLSGASLTKITNAFVKQAENSQIAIKNRYCPIEGRSQLEELKQKVSEQSAIDSLVLAQEKIIKACRK